MSNKERVGFYLFDDVVGKVNIYAHDKRFFHSATAGTNLLRSQRAAQCSGGDGCITIWINDAGKYRASFERYTSTITTATFTTKKSLYKWLKDKIPHTKNFDAGAVCTH